MGLFFLCLLIAVGLVGATGWQLHKKSFLWVAITTLLGIFAMALALANGYGIPNGLPLKAEKLIPDKVYKVTAFTMIANCDALVQLADGSGERIFRLEMTKYDLSVGSKYCAKRLLNHRPCRLVLIKPPPKRQ